MLNDEDWQVEFTANDIQRMAETLLASKAGSSKWDERRRVEYIEESRAMIMSVLRATPQDREDEAPASVSDRLDTEARRIDADDFTSIFTFEFKKSAGFSGVANEIGFALNDDWSNGCGSTLTTCGGFDLDVLAFGADLGIHYMDAKDLEGMSEAINFGLDFIIAEGGCQIEL